MLLSTVSPVHLHKAVRCLVESQMDFNLEMSSSFSTFQLYSRHFDFTHKIVFQLHSRHFWLLHNEKKKLPSLSFFLFYFSLSSVPNTLPYTWTSLMNVEKHFLALQWTSFQCSNWDFLAFARWVVYFPAIDLCSALHCLKCHCVEELMKKLLSPPLFLNKMEHFKVNNN